MIGKYTTCFGLSIAFWVMTAIGAAWAQAAPAATDHQASAAGSAAPALQNKAGEPGAPNSDSYPEGTPFPMVRAFGGLGVVLSLIVFGFLGVRKFAPQYFKKPLGERDLRVVETLPMGDKRSIALVEIGDKRLLIGNTPNQITLLAQLSLPVSLVESDMSLPPLTPSGGKGRASFRNLYEVEKTKEGAAPAKTIPPDIRAKMRQLREALEK